MGVESTVLSLLASPPVILRPGGITREMLCAVLGENVLDLTDKHQDFSGIPPLRA